MSRRQTGLVSTWAENQRQHQRQAEAQHRAVLQQQRTAERQQLAAERALARSRREQQAAYRQRREEDARRRTEALERRSAELAGLLRAGCAAPLFAPSALELPERIEPFAPGPLAVPVPMPREDAYRVAAPGRRPGGGREQRAAREAYERDLRTARAAEARRQAQLADYTARYEDWARRRRAEIRAHNEGVRAVLERVRRGEPDAVEEYLTAALYASAAFPEGLPRQVAATYEGPERRLVLNWELPPLAVVPSGGPPTGTWWRR
jgi:restriction system protein